MLLSLLLLVTPLAAAGQRPGVFRPRRPAAAGAPGTLRRQALQQEVFTRFMDRVSERLALTSVARQRLEEVLRANNMRRRELAQDARAARRDLVAATADPNTPPAEFDRLLGRMADLRARDLDLWRSEQAELERVLTARQRAQLMAMRLDLAEMMQRARQARRASPDTEAQDPP
jgi:Spy/CpxP family protein refolding chaperone